MSSSTWPWDRSLDDESNLWEQQGMKVTDVPRAHRARRRRPRPRRLTRRTTSSWTRKPRPSCPRTASRGSSFSTRCEGLAYPRLALPFPSLSSSSFRFAGRLADYCLPCYAGRWLSRSLWRRQRDGDANWFSTWCQGRSYRPRSSASPASFPSHRQPVCGGVQPSPGCITYGPLCAAHHWHQA